MNDHKLPNPISWKERESTVNLIVGLIDVLLVTVFLWALSTIGWLTLPITIVIVLVGGVLPVFLMVYRARHPEPIEQMQKEASVVRRIPKDGIGVIAVSRGRWEARSVDGIEIPEGVSVKIVARRGVIAYVRPLWGEPIPPAQ